MRPGPEKEGWVLCQGLNYNANPGLYLTCNVKHCLVLKRDKWHQSLYFRRGDNSGDHKEDSLGWMGETSGDIREETRKKALMR